MKLYRGDRGFLSSLRPARALRTIRAYERVRPIPSPRPLSWRLPRHPEIESILIYEFVRGTTLLQHQRDPDRAARVALPRLFADMFAARVLHGDVHAGNLLWDGETWWILDLDGIRGRLHALRRRRILEKLWGRLLFDLVDHEDARRIHAEFLELAGCPWPTPASWERILAWHREDLRQRALRGVSSPAYEP